MMKAWKQVSLSEVCNFRKGRKPDRVIKDPQIGFLPYILIENFGGARTTYTDDKKCVECSFDDTLIVCDGARCGLSSTGHSGYIGSTIAALIPDKTRITPRFLFYFVHDQFELLNTRVRGSAVPHIERSLLMSLAFSLPPLDEQERIVRLLDEADALRRLRQQANTRMDTFIPALFYEMFGDPVNSHATKHYLYELCTVEDDIKCGPFGTQLLQSEYTSQGIPLWGIKHVNKHFLQPTIEFLTIEKARRLKAYSLIPGDIVMTRKATVGNCTVYPENFPMGIMHSDLLRIRLNRKICDPIFLSIQLAYSEEIKLQVEGVSSGALTKGINVGKLKTVKINVPPLSLQREFAERVREARALQAAQEASAGRIEALFQSMLARAFAGEL